MDLSGYPPEIQDMLRRQLEAVAQAQASGGHAPPIPPSFAAQGAAPPAPPPPALAAAPAPAPASQGAPVTIQPAAPPQSSGNPLLAGNDALRRQFYEHPELAPPNAQQWLDEREQHILGNDAPPPQPPAIGPAAPLPQASGAPSAGFAAPAPAAPPMPPPMLPPSGGSGAPPGFVPPPPSAPPPMLAQAPAAVPPPAGVVPPTVAPHPLADPPTAAIVSPLPQQAPLVSALSPAPRAPASAHIDDRVTPAQRSFTPAWQPPPLPSFLNARLAPDPGAYRPAPAMPGYAMPRSGNPFRPRSSQPPLLPGFDNPFTAPVPGAAGGPIAFGGTGLGGGIGSPGTGQPYDDSLFTRFLTPNIPLF